MMVQTTVSLDRIASFLRLHDLQSDVIERLPRGSSDTEIEIIDGNFSWDLSSLNPTLKDINLKVQHGMRVAVCGTVGSGKSSLLSCILGEVPKISGLLSCVGQRHMLLNPLGYKVARLKRIYCLVRRWKEKSMRGSLKYVPSRKILKFSHSLIRGSDGHR